MQQMRMLRNVVMAAGIYQRWPGAKRNLLSRQRARSGKPVLRAGARRRRLTPWPFRSGQLCASLPGLPL